LLVIYVLQRIRGDVVGEKRIKFEVLNHYNIIHDTVFISKLKEIGIFDIDIYNSLQYLKEKGYIIFSETFDSDKYNSPHIIQNIRVTANGIDIIENISQDKDSRDKFSYTFNIKMADTVTIDSLIKNEINFDFHASVI